MVVPKLVLGLQTCFIYSTVFDSICLFKCFCFSFLTANKLNLPAKINVFRVYHVIIITCPVLHLYLGWLIAKVVSFNSPVTRPLSPYASISSSPSLSAYDLYCYVAFSIIVCPIKQAINQPSFIHVLPRIYGDHSNLTS